MTNANLMKNESASPRVFERKSLAWFLGLFAFCILLSQSAMDLFASLLSLTAMWVIFRRWQVGQSLRTQIPLLGFDLLLVLWFLVVAASFAFSPLHDTEWLPRLLQFRWILVFYLLIWTFKELSPSEKIIPRASALLSFCSAYAIFVWILGRDPINPDYNLAPWVGGHRTGGFLSNAMVFGHVYGTVFCVFLGVAFYAVKARGMNVKWLALALGLTGIAVILSFTRGIWLAMAVATVAMAFVYRPRIGVLVSGAGALALWVLTWAWPTLGQRITLAFDSGDERQWIWKGHTQIFLEHPILGVGYAENSRIIGDYYQQIGAPEGVIISHAHNQYLHFLAGTGVVGCLIYVSVLTAFMLLTLKVYRRMPAEQTFNKGLVLGCFGAQVAFVIGGLTEANFEHSKMKYVMMVVWALVVWQAHRGGLVKTKSSPA